LKESFKSEREADVGSKAIWQLWERSADFAILNALDVTFFPTFDYFVNISSCLSS
jgi:hypothetical protein